MTSAEDRKTPSLIPGMRELITDAPPMSFFEDCAFVCIDIQEEPRRTYYTEENPHPGFHAMGHSVKSCNDAIDYEFDVCHPNAKKAADAGRKLGLQMIFVHWGYQFENGMDLDPQTRGAFLKQYGMDYSQWPHHINNPSSRPATFFQVRDGEYVIAKTAQDAFPSCNIHYVLQNLGMKRIVFIGGHANGCLGRSSESAKTLGYEMMCVIDATYDGTQARHIPGLVGSQYDYYITAEQLMTLAS